MNGFLPSMQIIEVSVGSLLPQVTIIKLLEVK